MRWYAAAAAALMLTGCGGGSGSPTTSSTAVVVPPRAATGAPASSTQPKGLSHTALVSRMNALCATYTAKIEVLRRSPASTITVVEDAQRLQRESLPKFQALSASGEDRAALARYVQALRRQTGLYGRLIEAAHRNSQASVETVTDLIKHVARERATAAIDLGAEKCGRV